MHKLQYHEMTDEELALFSDTFKSICGLLDSMPGHLITPLLLRIAVGTYLDMKGFKANTVTTQLAQDLVVDLTVTLHTNTERHITERN